MLTSTRSDCRETWKAYIVASEHGLLYYSGSRNSYRERDESYRASSSHLKHHRGRPPNDDSTLPALSLSLPFIFLLRSVIHDSRVHSIAIP